MNKLNQNSKLERFKKLHDGSKTFVLPNAWDPISAKVFEDSGFKAIGTTSAGIATSLGYPDGQHIPINKMIEVTRNIVKSVNVPVSADIEAGFGNTVEEILNVVKKVVESGAVGINLEDGTGDPTQPMYDLSLQKEKILAIKNHFNSTNDSQVFINARTDTYWLKIGNAASRFHETVERARMYEKAGADCIFIPGLSDPLIIRNLRREISSPINLLVDSQMPSVNELSTIKIERLSCGSAPFRATTTLLKKISEELLNEHTYHHMTDQVLSYDEVKKYTH